MADLGPLKQKRVLFFLFLEGSFPFFFIFFLTILTFSSFLSQNSDLFNRILTLNSEI